MKLRDLFYNEGNGRYIRHCGNFTLTIFPTGLDRDDKNRFVDEYTYFKVVIHNVSKAWQPSNLLSNRDLVTIGIAYDLKSVHATIIPKLIKVLEEESKKPELVQNLELEVANNKPVSEEDMEKEEEGVEMPPTQFTNVDDFFKICEGMLDYLSIENLGYIIIKRHGTHEKTNSILFKSYTVDSPIMFNRVCLIKSGDTVGEAMQKFFDMLYEMYSEQRNVASSKSDKVTRFMRNSKMLIG